MISLQPHRFMNLVFGWCVEHLDPAKREEWETLLSDPLPGREKTKPTPFQADQEGADFMATLAAHQARAV